MSRYIDADALCKLARNHVDGTVDCNDIMRFPTVDAVPVDFLKQFAEGKRGYYSDFVIEAVKAYKGCANYEAGGERIER